MALAHYRDASVSDIDHLVELVETCYRSEESARTWTSEYRLVKGNRSSPDEIAESVNGSGSLMIVGEVESALASCCRLTTKPQRRVQLGLFCVRPELQSRGLGSELLETAIRTARERFDALALSLHVLSVRDELRAWYERTGFHETGERLALAREMDASLALVRDLEFVVYEREV